MRTFGTAELVDGYWHVSAEPHVALRLKRTFGRLSKEHNAVLQLRATDEVSRDLEWFCQRFPLEVKQPDELAKRASKHREDADAFDRLVSGQAQPTMFELAIPPRDYQRVAAEAWLLTRGMLLADDVGLGKTASAICGLTDPRTRPALVVTLTHLPPQWEREIKRFCPKLRTHIIKKATPYDVRLGVPKKGARKQETLIEPEFPDVIIINYAKLSGWSEAFAGVVKSVVFDEIQELRRSASERYAAANRIAMAALFRLGLSATPIYNYGNEFHNVLSVLRPDVMGELHEFITEWCKAADMQGRAEIKEPKAFGSYVREAGVMLRRTRADVARELPALTDVVHHCAADTSVLAEAESAAAELARIILSKESAWEARGQATRELDWRLRQATGIAKAPYVAAFVRMLVESGEKVLLYGWHHAVYDIWADQLKDLKPVFYTGEESPAAKEKSRSAFIDGDAKVLIMSLRAGAGLDGLQAVCRTVVYGELDWAYGVKVQSTGRIHRDGQRDPVMAYFLVSDEGSDPIVAEVCGLKRAQLEGVTDPTADLVEKLSSDAADGIRRLAERYLSSKDRSRNAEVAA